MKGKNVVLEIISVLFFISCIVGCHIGYGQNSNNHSDNRYLSNREYDLFKNIALEKADYFYVLLNHIGNKNTPKDSLNYYFEEAEKLFHDSAVMQIQLKNGNQKSRPIMLYLKRLSLLNYTELTIKVFSAFFVTDLHYVKTRQVGASKITEYEGVIAFEQYFEGKIATEVVYADTTLKAIRVHLLAIETDTGQNWNVLLGDIYVLAVS